MATHYFIFLFIMTYQETIDYLYQLLPVFHREGKKAFKANLTNTIKICEHLGNPQQQFKSIHIAGTNGKGSTSHFLSSILQESGYKTGLYTSPHLKSFTERIRINGNAIPEQEVINFVEQNNPFILDLRPSFFECTVGLAFQYFAQQRVDIAVIEVGLGGRLDSTNVITPELSLITNISLDHTDILGDTLELIAAEKAGIIKPNIPVVISEKHPITSQVFNNKAQQENTIIAYATDKYQMNDYSFDGKYLTIGIKNKENGQITPYKSELVGHYQFHNIIGVLRAVDTLREQGYAISDEALSRGIQRVVTNTGLKGRWQKLSESPTTICDTGHNIAGISEIVETLRKMEYRQLWMILGFVSDKDITGILQLLPKEANFIFCQAKVPRAFQAQALSDLANEFGLRGQVITDVNDALNFVRQNCKTSDLVYIGGSTFVVADLDEL